MAVPKPVLPPDRAGFLNPASALRFPSVQPVVWTVAVLASLALILAFAALRPGPSMAAEAQKRVLVITSYHQGDLWNDNVTLGVREVLDSRNDVSLSFENLDLRRFIGPGQESLVAGHLRAKYRDKPQDLIIVSDDPALDVLLAIRAQVFPGVPVVFCGVNNFRPERIKGQTDITGVNEEVSLAATLELALKLFPKTTRIMAQVSDKEANSRTHLESFRRVAEQFKGRVEFVELMNLTPDSARETLPRLPEGCLVLRLINILNPEGGYLSLQESMRILAEYSPAPVFTSWDFDVGEGALGGYVTSGLEQGRKAAGLAAMILDGRRADEIPVVMKSPNIPMFDHARMERYGLSASALPPDAVIAGRPFGFYDHYKPWIWSGVAVVAVLSALVLVLLAAILRRKAAEERLRESEAKYRNVIEHISDVYYRTDAKGLLHMISPSGVRLLAYDSDKEMLGLQNEHFWAHPEERAGFLALLREHGEVNDYEVELKRKDGSRVVVSTSSRLCRDGEGNILGVEGIFRDITARKAAENALREGEQRLRSIYDSVSDAIFMHDSANGRILDVNRRACEIYGYSREEILSMDVERLSSGEPPYTQDEAVRRVGQALRGPVAPFEWQARDKSGRVFWALVSMSTVEFGGILRVLVSVQDIDELKSAEKALRASREELRQVIDLVPHYIYAKDLDGRYVLANKAVAAVYGVTPQELVGKTDADFAVAGREAAGFISCDAQVIESGCELVIPDECLTGADGTQRRLTTVKVPFTFSGSGRPAVLSVSVDITENILMQEVMVQTEKMMSVGGLAAGMAHEINNPLSGILQSAQVTLARMEADTPANREAARASGCGLESIRAYLDRRGIRDMVAGMRDSAVRAAHIVASMLEFSRAGTCAKQPADVRLLLEKSLELCGTDYDMKKNYDFRNLQITKEFDPDLPPVECSSTQIQQVFMNILINAAQAMEGRPSPRITLRAARRGGDVTVEIEDNGPGMPENVRKRIFEPFFTTKEVGKGTGLGLSVSYFIVVNHHHGSMDVFSAPGQGTRFSVTLPAVQPGEK